MKKLEAGRAYSFIGKISEFGAFLQTTSKVEAANVTPTKRDSETYYFEFRVLSSLEVPELYSKHIPVQEKTYTQSEVIEFIKENARLTARENCPNGAATTHATIRWIREKFNQ